MLFKQIEDFTAGHPHARVYTSLGQLRHLSSIAQVDGVVGNSSSGLAEVPSFKKGTINIGDRQRGRLKATSVIDCQPSRKAILAALQRLYSAEFQASLGSVVNPYGTGGASEAVVAILESTSFNQLLKKCFFDWPSTGKSQFSFEQ